jgi:hypothetical protein
MIIRPVCRDKYASIPNAVLNDERLSIDTRGMVAYLLSKPRDWIIRPRPLARALSKKGSAPVGRKRLNRMLREATDAGYVSRATTQTHLDDGSWGHYDYIVGMPADVKEAASEGGVAFSPQSPAAPALQAHALQGGRSHKVSSRQRQIEKNYVLARREQTEDSQPSQDEYSEYGKHALANGCKFAWEGSKPFNTWRTYRQSRGETWRLRSMRRP